MALENTLAAKHLGRLPKKRRHERKCPICRQDFTATARGVYCSARCRALASWRRLHPKSNHN